MVSTSESIEAAERWYKMDPNPITANYVKHLLDRSADEPTAMDELTSLFPPDNRRISFGTAGLRSAMKPGPLGMNDLVVVQAAQGIARYCLQQQQQKNTSGDTKPKAVIGYDHRLNPDLNISSLSFAILTALVFEEAGIEPILLDGFAFTPLVPFVLQQTHAIVGIMVTASHNPKEDDGYKVYASDGCQIRAPMDADIATEIMKNLRPWKDYGSILKEKQEQFKIDPCLGMSLPNMTNEMIDAYFAALKSHGLMTGQASLLQEAQSINPPEFAYTAMHGVGFPFAERVFQEFGLPPFAAIPAQKDPDFKFPTVPFPNPEEKGALDIAKAFATDNNCDIVLANDPDADRLAVAEKDRTTDEWTVFSGDQIGSMLGHWIWIQIGKDCGKVR
jgi:phosphoglucomutase